MPNSRLQSPWLLTLLCVMLLVVRVSGAHLHLCFDGRESPASLHLMDNGMHLNAPGMDAGHQDVDIAFAGEVVVKFAKLGLDLPVLLLAALLVWSLLKPPRQPAPGYRNPLPLFTARSLRPPLRGPPLHSPA